MIWVTNLHNSDVSRFLRGSTRKDWVIKGPNPTTHCSLENLRKWGMVGIYKPETKPNPQFKVGDRVQYLSKSECKRPSDLSLYGKKGTVTSLLSSYTRDNDSDKDHTLVSFDNEEICHRPFTKNLKRIKIEEVKKTVSEFQIGDRVKVLYTGCTSNLYGKKGTIRRVNTVINFSGPTINVKVD